MDEKDVTRLYQFADLVHGVARQIQPPGDLEPGPCSIGEITVMRYIHNNPGTAAGPAAAAVNLPSSNFSRLIKGLENKELVRREADAADNRGVRLFTTERAEANFDRMRAAWAQALDDIPIEPRQWEEMNGALRKIEAELIKKRVAQSPSRR